MPPTPAPIPIPLLAPVLESFDYGGNRPDDVFTGDGAVELLVLIVEENPDVAAVLKVIDELELAAAEGSTVPP
ncbi:hypothetical protein SUNI508_07081 [Seiridium unicorne]|uniref:Uncharacterized protein n=1 Tax=Seiridium unicorne TaxID=138068 RepID=A0ABR2UZ46_9PEZI